MLFKTKWTRLQFTLITTTSTTIDITKSSQVLVRKSTIFLRTSKFLPITLKSTKCFRKFFRT